MTLSYKVVTCHLLRFFFFRILLSKWVLLKLQSSLQSPGVRGRVVSEPQFQSSWFSKSGWGLRICIFNRLSDDADAAMPGATLRTEALNCSEQFHWVVDSMHIISPFYDKFSVLHLFRGRAKTKASHGLMTFIRRLIDGRESSNFFWQIVAYYLLYAR